MNISLKKFITLVLCLTVIGSSNIYADNNELDITMEEAVEKAVTYNNNINLIKLNERQILRGVKDAKDGASSSQYALSKYIEYINLYNDGGSHIQKYKDMSDDEAKSASYLAQLSIQNNPNMNWEKLMLLEEQIKFVEYRYMFGSEEPKLHDDERYSKYSRNIELASLQAENLKDKYYNNLKGAEKGLRSQVIMAYIQYLGLEESLISQEKLQSLMKKMKEEAKIKFDSGNISELDYNASKEQYDMAVINTDILKLNMANMENVLKSLMGIDLNQKIDLTTDILVDKNYTMVNLKDYIDMAKTTSYEYSNQKIEYEYKSKELETYDKYVKYMTRDKQIVIDDRNLEEKELATLEKDIESNVKYALENIMELKSDIKVKEADYKIKLDKYLQGKKQLELGLITESNLNALELEYMNSLIGLTQSKRAAYNAEIKFELLINSGIAYK